MYLDIVDWSINIIMMMVTVNRYKGFVCDNELLITT
jgi:hypothetical protein